MRVEGVKFAIVPEWVIDRLADKPRALVVYARLSRWSNVDGDVNRSRDELADACGISRDTLDRAMTDLKQSGCLIVTPQHDKQGNQLCNRYTLTSQPVPHIDGTADLRIPLHVDGPADLRHDPSLEGGADLRPLKDKPKRSSIPKKESHARRPKTPKEIRHDRMVTAFVESFGWKRDEITENQWGQLHKAAKMLTEIDANPGDVHGRMLHYPELFRGAACTPLAVASHWAALTEGWRDLIDEEEI